MRRPTIVRRHNGGTGAALLTAERTNYDALGRVTSVQAGAAFSGTSITSWQTVESRTYTPTGQVATVRNGANNTVTNTYDALDRLYQVTDPVGRRTRFVYDAAGQLTREIRAQGTPLQQDYRRYAYRPNGQISYVRDANNNRTTYIYDGFDRLERVRFPMPAVGANQSNSSDYEAYIYDAAGNRTSVRLRDGQTISFTYDALNRMTLKDVPGTAQDVFYAYDLAGRPLSSRFGSVSGQGVVFAYDSAGRMTSETSYGRAVSFQYDGAGNRTRLTWPDGQYVQYVWDGANRVSQVRANGASSGAGLLAQYGYDARSRPESLIRGGGSGPRTDYGFDAASRLTQLAHDLSVPASDQILGFSWTAAGQLASRTMSNPAYRWTPPSGHAASYQANGL
jgi:YD repeat-containing protein